MEKELFKTSIIENTASLDLELNMTEAEGRDLPSVEQSADSGDVYACCCCCCC